MIWPLKLCYHDYTQLNYVRTVPTFVPKVESGERADVRKSNFYNCIYLSVCVYVCVCVCVCVYVCVCVCVCVCV